MAVTNQQVFDTWEETKQDIKDGLHVYKGEKYDNLGLYTQSYRITFPRYESFSVKEVGPVAASCLDVIAELDESFRENQGVDPAHWFDHCSIPSITKDSWILEIVAYRQRSEFMPIITVALAAEFPESTVTSRRT